MKLNLLQIFSATTVAPWISESFPIIRAVLIVLITVLSLALVLVTLFQDGDESGMGALGGGSADTFNGKNKSQTLTSMLKRITVIISIAIAVLAVLFFISVAIYNGN